MLDDRGLEIVACAGAGLGLLGLLLALLTARALARMRRSVALLQRDGDNPSFLDAAARTMGEVDALRERTAGLADDLAAVRAQLRRAVRQVSLVRYDAFPDVGGRMSFSVAMLAEDGDGVVMSAINGRQETRVYAKRVTGGESEKDLSPEERQAIGESLGPEPAARAG